MWAPFLKSIAIMRLSSYTLQFIMVCQPLAVMQTFPWYPKWRSSCSPKLTHQISAIPCTRSQSSLLNSLWQTSTTQFSDISHVEYMSLLRIVLGNGSAWPRPTNIGWVGCLFEQLESCGRYVSLELGLGKNQINYISWFRWNWVLPVIGRKRIWPKLTEAF